MVGWIFIYTVEAAVCRVLLSQDLAVRPGRTPARYIAWSQLAGFTARTVGVEVLEKYGISTRDFVSSESSTVDRWVDSTSRLDPSRLESTRVDSVDSNRNRSRTRQTVERFGQ